MVVPAAWCLPVVALTVVVVVVTSSPTAAKASGSVGPEATTRQTARGDAACPSVCTCRNRKVVCSNAGLSALPRQLRGANIRELDLSNNNFHTLPMDLYKSLPSLEKLDFSHNRIEKIPRLAFKKLPLQTLSLAWNEVDALAADALEGLTKLIELDLSSNRLSSLHGTSFGSLRRLQELNLDRNTFSKVPSKALEALVRLEVLSLGNNRLTRLPENAFKNLGSLRVLNLKNNYITEVEDEAFAGLTSLNALELEGNLLTDIPKGIGRLTAVQSIQLSSNKLTYVRDGVLQRSPSLEKLELRGNPILSVGRFAFSNMPRLKELELLGVKELSVFPNLNGTSQLVDLRIYGSQLTSVPDDLCSIAPGLRRIYLPSNRLRSLPRLERCADLRLLDVSYNSIESVSGEVFSSQYYMHDLLLRYNRIKTIPGGTFLGLTHLLVLDLRYNEISFIAEDAFIPTQRLQRLNLNGNRFPRLPFQGLSQLLHLHCSNIAELREFPGPQELPQLLTVEVSYAYHCCQFSEKPPQKNNTLTQIKETIIYPSKDEVDFSMWDDPDFNGTWPESFNLSSTLGDLGKTLLQDFHEGAPPTAWGEVDEDDSGGFQLFGAAAYGEVRCSPAPTPFMPCEDLFDWWTLRCGVWVVFLLALLGNGTVVFVLIFARSKMDVPRFLVCNLAAADFFMGVYLGFLAVVDASTLGQFRKYAIAWQMSAGCQLAGFLGVLSSELSVYTLAVITMERNYAITHAMHLNKRLSIKHASYIMACGWAFALVMAMLPLVGVSDYRRFAVCLPFQTAGPGTGYVVFLMFVNGVAFTILMGCYWKMYCAIRGSQAWNSNDSRIAKRMALLVFTDFLCWAPIAFFAVTAAFGVRLIDLSGAKVFTVFILPFNSCCNPFLYAIMTKQFKKDCVLICKAIEESRVTRGIGRCRHSSNFSNRHTPANTNSLADRASKESKDSAQCSCSQRLLSENNPPPTQSRWDAFRALWCPAQPKETLDSSNDYAYQIAEIQKNQEKNKRNASLSSDNFSSSRSDSLRQANGAVKAVPNRRRNSWTVTRKPSQESNLSSSRNDSSATAGSNTTQSWRLSRSSVSSDMSSSALMRGQGSLHKQALAGAELVERAGSLRSRPLRPGAVRQNSGIVLPHSHPHPLLKQTSTGGILKPKPKLTRQIAFSDEAAAAAAAAGIGSSQTPGRHHENGCPLHCPDPPPTSRHSRFHNIYGKLTESSQEESSGVDEAALLEESPGAVGGACANTLPVHVSVEPGATGGGGGGRKGGLTVAFVPRKLSTISSQSFSLQRDSHNNLSQLSPEEETAATPAPLAALTPSAVPAAAAIEKAHSAGDVRPPSTRPRNCSSDTCISRPGDLPRFPPYHPPPAAPLRPVPAVVAIEIGADEGFDDIDDADDIDQVDDDVASEPTVVVRRGVEQDRRGAGEQVVPLLRERSPSGSPKPGSSASLTSDV